MLTCKHKNLQGGKKKRWKATSVAVHHVFNQRVVATQGSDDQAN